MAITTAIDRQPNNLDLARSTQFKFDILKVPNTVYFAQEINLPGIAFSGDAIMNSRYKAMPFMGDTLDFSPLELSFLVQEDLSNYREIHDWMTGIGFPEARTQFGNLKTEGGQVVPSQGKSAGQENISGMFSDATLTITSAKNNPVIEARFQDVYPVALSALAYNQQESDITYLTANVTFTYKIYTLHTL